MRLIIYRLIRVIKRGSLLQLIMLYNDEPKLQYFGFDKIKSIYDRKITNYQQVKRLLIEQQKLF